MRILYVEDDRTSRSVFLGGLRAHLGDEWEVEAVETAEEGLERIKTGLVDLLVTDMVLPEMSGIDLLRAVREILPNLEVILLTGHGSVSSAIEAMRLGARDYLEKPLDIGLLSAKLVTIRDLITRREELVDLREAKETVERQAGHEVHLLERKLLDSRQAIDNALKILRQEDISLERVVDIRDILTPYSTSPEADKTEGT